MTKVNWKNNWRKMEQSSTRIIPSKNKSNYFYRFHDLRKESDSQKRQHSNIWWFLLKSSIYDTKSWWRFLTNWHNFWYVLEKQYVHTYANARKQAEKSAELVPVSIKRDDQKLPLEPDSFWTSESNKEAMGQQPPDTGGALTCDICGCVNIARNTLLDIPNLHLIIKKLTID